MSTIFSGSPDATLHTFGTLEYTSLEEQGSSCWCRGDIPCGKVVSSQLLRVRCGHAALQHGAQQPGAPLLPRISANSIVADTSATLGDRRQPSGALPDWRRVAVSNGVRDFAGLRFYRLRFSIDIGLARRPELSVRGARVQKQTL